MFCMSGHMHEGVVLVYIHTHAELEKDISCLYLSVCYCLVMGSVTEPEARCLARLTGQPAYRI